ncbi:MAG: Membrane fusion protein Cu(I)/Ag(I) efflux system, partial [Verrucomicrobiaceae bacterium]|nr:Membrane fusion protein Cu(I)/Ag(I) efflux system [Verrucomicrobiaceae bacterium]
MKRFLYSLLLIGTGAAASWYGRPWLLSRQTPSAAAMHAATERKVLYYQSAMHPWVKSAKPGRCTICGMELVPVFEGDKGFETGGDIVTLDQSFIQVLHVQTEEVKKRPLTKTLQVAGMVDDNAASHRVLSAYTDGRVDALHVNYVGAEVEAGQPLAEFYSPTLLQAEREYRQLTGELRGSTALRLRQMGLTAAQVTALPQKAGDALTSQILSPVGGTVVARYVYPGQYVKEGDKLFELADFSTMWFIFNAYEQDVPWLGVGQEVTVTTPAAPGKKFIGKVSFIDPTLDEATRSVKVRVDLPNHVENGKRCLLHKLYADGAVKLEAPEVLTVPRLAVIETGPEAVVYVEQGSGAYARQVVKTGRRGDALVEILSGVKAGDKVVTNGNLLIDGQAEMNRAYTSPPEAPKPAMALPLAALNDQQSKAASDFLKLADAMANALAADDLPAFTRASAPATDVTDSFATALKNR